MPVEIRLRTSPSMTGWVRTVSNSSVAIRVTVGRPGLAVTRVKHVDPPQHSPRLACLSTLIDLHCHILPGIDDGALDLSDSLAMARVGAADGIAMIAATPHIRHDHEVRIPELPGRVEEVNGELRREGVPVEVVTGGEVAETALAGLDEDELRALALGGGSW